jgi:hypothetical protein
MAAALTALTALTLLTTAGCGAIDPIGPGRSYAADAGRPTVGGTDAGPTTDPGSDGIASQDFTPGASGADATGASPSEPIPQAAYALMKKLVAEPAGAHAWPAKDTGPLGLDGFIAKFYIEKAQAKEKTLAQKRGFQGAVNAGWFNENGSQEGIFLVRLGSEGDASDMYYGLTGAWENDTALTTFTDGEVQGEGAVTVATDDLGNYDVRIAFYVGATFAEIHYWSKAADKAAARAAALAQYQELFKS